MAVACDAVVIGGGIIGLACGVALASRGVHTIVLERHGKPGTETTSRNSQVIHAGLYYDHGSRKAELCLRGAGMLYAYCARRGVAHRRTGKLVVAEASELGSLEALAERATRNGAGVRLVSGARVAELEPNVRAAGALEASDSGIVDTHALVSALAADLAAAGGLLACGRRVVAAERSAGDHGWAVRCEGVAGAESVEAPVVVNAAGLAADAVAGLFGIDVDASGYRQRWVKGSYFRVRRRHGAAPLVRRLVYPLPPADGEGLGIHATATLDGSVRLGPDAEALGEGRRKGSGGDAAAHYDVDEGRRDAFHRAAARYLPSLAADDLVPDMAGIRPKLVQGGDFVIADEGARGLPGLRGLWTLAGIESPGLTAALAIADHVACAIVKG